MSHHIQLNADADIVIALVGNKADLKDRRAIQAQVMMMQIIRSKEMQRLIITQEAEAYATDNEFMFIEASAKTGQNVSELFSALGLAPSRILRHHLSQAW